MRKILHVCKVILYKFLFLMFSAFFKVNPQKIFFSSFLGLSYSGNPRSISEYMHENYPNYNLVWAFKKPKDKCGIVPDYLTKVKFGSIMELYHCSTSGVWIHDYCVSGIIPKRKGQIYIQTWHGDRPFKKVLADAHLTNKKLYESDNCDLMVAASDFGEKVYHSSFKYHGEILKVGSPRNDDLVNRKFSLGKKAREFYNIPDNVKVVLYAPTFRDSNKSNNQSAGDFNINEVISALEETTSEKWICAVRGHTGRRIEIDGIDVTDYEDTKDILLMSDAIISDYSSISTDFALLKKPVFLYVEDLETYKENDRELWFDFKDSPFWYATNQMDLIKLIRNCTVEKAKSNCEEILDFYKTKETGCACKIICDYIANNKQ